MSSAPLEAVGVVGGGFMGSGIAETAARAGLHAVVHEPEQAPLDRSGRTIEASVAKGVARGKPSDAEGTSLLERVTWSTDVEALAPAQVVLEAIVEDARVKGRLFQRLDELPPDCELLASNTSSIPVAEIASGRSGLTASADRTSSAPCPSCRSSRSCGRSTRAPRRSRPPAGPPRSSASTSSTPRTARASSSTPCSCPTSLSATRMYEDGFASREDIDEGMRRGCGHPMGPLTLADFIGLDVMYAIGQSLHEEFKRPDFAPPPFLKRVVVSGHFGRKTGRGSYTYGDTRS